ncbi:hypothetical protein P4B35_23355, partial [Pontiellaceae bacterium B12227]|nr:hypothetical protein [Pontiellaceae bacterium B12227]
GADGAWVNSIIQYTAATKTFELFVTVEGSTNVAQSIGTQVFNVDATYNPNNIELKVGANRGVNQQYAGDVANIQIYDDVSVDVDALFLAGPGLAAGPPVPVATYDFGDGNLTDDSSGNGNTLALTGNVTTNADAFSAHFDDSVPSFLKSSTLNITSEYTVSFWWQTDTPSQGANDSLLSSTAGAGDWQLESGVSGQIRLNGDNGQITSPAPYLANTWYHTVISATASNVAFYVTEANATTVNPIGTTSAIFSLDDLRIGVDRAESSTYASDMAFVQVYTQALDVAALDSVLAAGKERLPATPVAIYDFGDGNLLNDSTGNANDLALTGNVTTNADGFSAHFDDSVPSFLKSSTLNIAGSSTVSFWWQTDTPSQGANDSLLSSTAGAGDWQLESGASGKIRLNGDNGIIASPAAYLPGVWYHTVIDSEISDVTTNVSLYITPAGSTEVNLVGSTNTVFNLGDLRIGINRGENVTYKSDMGLVTVYDSSASLSVLNTLLAEGNDAIAAIPLPPADAIAHYDFGDGDLLNDSSGNNNTLTNITNNGGTAPTLNADGFSVRLTGTGVTNSYLEADLNASAGANTVSFWWKTDSFDQPGNSSFISSLGPNDWQVELTGGLFQLFGDNGTISVPTSTLSTGTWYHTAIVSSGTDVSLYVTERGSSEVNLIGSQAGVFSLTDLLIGINRAKNNPINADIGDVYAFNAEVGVAQLNSLLNDVSGAATSNGTPHFWLDDYNLVTGGDYEAADLEDSDLDGLLNWQEYQAGTVPTNAASVLKLSRVTALSGNSYEVAWQAVDGKQYDVLYRTDLLFGQWLTNEVSVLGIEPETVSTATVDSVNAFFKVQLSQ